MTRLGAVHVHVARRCGELYVEAVERLFDLDLAAEARRVGEAKGEVEHVVFVITGLLEMVVCVLIEDDVARRAGNRALAGAFEVDVVLVRNAQQVVALVRLDGLDGVPIRVLKVDLDPASATTPTLSLARGA